MPLATGSEVTTDNERQWHLILADGTKGWLNVASSIQYPISFTANGRVVAMTGEDLSAVLKQIARWYNVTID